MIQIALGFYCSWNENIWWIPKINRTYTRDTSHTFISTHLSKRS